MTRIAVQIISLAVASFAGSVSFADSTAVTCSFSRSIPGTAKNEKQCPTVSIRYDATSDSFTVDGLSGRWVKWQPGADKDQYMYTALQSSPASTKLNDCYSPLMSLEFNDKAQITLIETNFHDGVVDSDATDASLDYVCP